MKAHVHEDFHRKETLKISSDRGFGLVLGVVLSVFGIWPVLRRGEARIWMLAAGGALLLAAATRPRLLHPLNRLWTWLGLLLGRVMNPVVMALMFYFVFTPFALFFRLMGKDPLRLKADPEADSYWIPRNPPGPAPDTMHNQF
jgi:hypothetical protein